MVELVLEAAGLEARGRDRELSPSGEVAFTSVARRTLAVSSGMLSHPSRAHSPRRSPVHKDEESAGALGARVLEYVDSDSPDRLEESARSRGRPRRVGARLRAVCSSARKLSSTPCSRPGRRALARERPPRAPREGQPRAP